MNGSRCTLCLDTVRLRLATCGLLIAFVASLGGCSHAPSQVVVPPAPPYHVQPGTWRAINEQILTASVYARVTMDEWQWRVRWRIDEVFIPWYSSYWTQQWIASRVTWYKLQYDEGEATPEERLVSYLQEQFYEQVLEPVSSFVDPQDVMEEAAAAYLGELKGRLDQLPLEYRIPVAAFNQHLESIPAIVVLAVPLQDASLYEVLQAADLPALPAYEALLRKIVAVNGTAGPTPSQDRLHTVARRAVTKLVSTLALRGGSTAASTIAGGFWSVLISAGAAAWGAVEHDHDKPEIEAQLRENLGAALDVIWQDLMEDQHGGVTAVVHHMSTQIEHRARHSNRCYPATPKAGALGERSGYQIAGACYFSATRKQTQLGSACPTVAGEYFPLPSPVSSSVPSQ